MEIVLASTSPRRRQLLTMVLNGAPLTVQPDADESRLPGEHPAEYALRVAALKLESAASSAAGRGDCLVIAGDTIVALGERVFGKPEHSAQAAAFLRALSGQTHQVISSLVMAHFQAGVEIDRAVCCETTAVTFR
jgi:septum formation protein